MEGLFIHVLNISITASFLVLAIIIFRLFAKKSPKWVSVLLWGLVGLRLLLPFSIESEVSLVPSKNTVPTTITQDRYPALDTGIDRIDEIVNPVLSGIAEAHPEHSASPVNTWITALGWIWLAVMLCMLLYMCASFIYLRIKTSAKLCLEDGVFLCDYVKTPFILGTVKPGIYLPSDISDKDYPLVLAHERAHIKRLDHVFKPLGFLLLSVYWFNPLLWVAYVLLCRDIEMACDEKVISELGDHEKAEYSEALLSLGIRNRVISACPLAFGEVSVKSRVSAISKYKKPATVVIVISLAVCAVFAACFLTYKAKDKVAINTGIWYAGKVIGTKEASATCDDVPLFVFTENGDILVESNDLAGLSYVRLGRMNSAYVSKSKYEELFDGVGFRNGYDAAYFHSVIKGAWRITPSVSSGLEHEEVYLLRSDRELYMGYADEGRIDTLYELRFNESLPTYLYTLKYTSPDVNNAALILDSSNGTGRIIFGDHSSYTALGSYEYANSRLIFTTDDYFELKLVFHDVGGSLIYSEKDSDTHGLSGLLPDGVSFRGYYQLYGASHCTSWFDINGDGSQELISANIGNGGRLWYLVHAWGVSLANETIPFTRYDELRFEEKDGSLYLVGEYSSTDFNSYRYKVTFDGAKLIFTPEG
ncbi:MAG: hypothetical protein IKC32_02240 [Clostridia bacterium]|nr:hypothetical protein [Clostridia bacterium]